VIVIGPPSSSTTIRTSSRGELEEAIKARLYAIADPREVGDPVYLQGLNASLGAAVDYAFSAIERGEGRAPQVPPVLLVQSRLAARNRIGLETILRRYVAGYGLLSEFAIAEGLHGDVTGGLPLGRLLRGQAAVFDRLITAVSEEHAREAAARTASSEQRRAQRIQRLLAGEAIDSAEFDYPFEDWHLGLIGVGSAAQDVLRDLAAQLDKRLLVVRRDDEVLWAWLGSRRGIAATEFERLASLSLPREVTLALGEPARGLSGWRFSHLQAKAALWVALRWRQSLMRYADIALVASIMQDDLLATWLRQRFLMPLSREADGAAHLLDTLRAYFAANHNGASAAAALGVSRQTIHNRLQTIESRLGCSLTEYVTELAAALRLDEVSRAIQKSAAEPAGA
jgi:hypothetical protein